MADVNFLQNLIRGAAKGGGDTSNIKVPDSSEQVIISSLALLKMLKHGRAGVPMEVMGNMLGSYIDEYTTKVIDVFAMPQSGTGVSVEAVDPVFQAKMLEMLQQTDRSENVVGWYHSHPGFGCWLSGVDVGTQQAFEKLEPRTIAVVVDPIQSVKGKVVIDAFRTVDQGLMMADEEFQQHTSNLGGLKRPTVQALYNGLNKHYYSIVIGFHKNENEQNMLLNLYKKKWNQGFKNQTLKETKRQNKADLDEIVRLSKDYSKWISLENQKTTKEFAVNSVGKVDPKRHLKEVVSNLEERIVLQNFGLSMNSKVF